jgi:hypothetical protein
LSNLKQLGLAVLQYAQDYDEVLPAPGYWGTGAGDDNGPLGRPWMPKILPYVKSTQVYLCPTLKVVNNSYAPPAAPTAIPTSYCWPELMSAMFSGGLPMPIRGQGAPGLSQIEEPSRILDPRLQRLCYQAQRGRQHRLRRWSRQVAVLLGLDRWRRHHRGAAERRAQRQRLAAVRALGSPPARPDRL